ncbi:MAG: HD domain-containing protein [Patescibacteria group bacterium]|nr:HD domain-containing protein [Patescibacteria group bacterium]
MDIVKEVRDFVEKECKKPTSKYGSEPFEFHFKPVVKYAVKMAGELGADKEVVEIAAWLHDIGSIIEGRGKHHLEGAKIAESKLKELGYPKAKIELVKRCILSHRGSEKVKPKTLEEKIIAEADIMSNFENIGGIFKAAFIFEGLNQEEAKKSVRKKLQNKYHQLNFEESKKEVKPKYEAAMLLLK